MIASMIVAAAEQTEEHHSQLPLSPLGYALCALALFFVLLMLTFAFRSVGTRH